MAVGNHMNQLSRLQAGDLGHHVNQHRVLAHVPVVGRQHILGPLVQNGVEGVAGHVEGHGVGAGVQVHLVQILKIIEVRENAPGGGVVLQIIQHPVHLVKLPLGIGVLLPQLIAVGLADGTGAICPGVPDVTV